jgi:hypothetical protein
MERNLQRIAEAGWRTRREERFLSAQADRFVPQNHPGRKKRAGAKREEKSRLAPFEMTGGVGVGRYVGAEAPTPESASNQRPKVRLWRPALGAWRP